MSLKGSKVPYNATLLLLGIAVLSMTLNCLPKLIMNILLLQFNNYSNRRIKFYSNVEDYISRASNSQYSLNNKYEVATVNFAPNDGIETVLNINWNEKWNPDYLLVLEEGTKKIISRWFIYDYKNLSKINFDFVLRRDVVADRYNPIVNSPCFIEKGYVSSQNPLIFNKEDFSCNQIKKNETLIADQSKCSWLVVYYNLSEKSHLNGDVTSIEEPFIALGAASITDWEIIQRYGANGYSKPTVLQFNIEVDMSNTTDEAVMGFNKDCNLIYEDKQPTLPTELEYTEDGFFWTGDWQKLKKTSAAAVACINSNKTNIINALKNFAQPQDDFENVFYYNGKIVKTTNGKFYRISVQPTDNTDIVRYLDVSGGASLAGENALATAIMNAFKTGVIFKTGWSGNFTKAILIDYMLQNYSVTYDEITNSVKNYHYDFSGLLDSQEIQDEPYGILAFPYKDVVSWMRIKANNEYIEDDLALKIIRDMTKDGIGASNKVFDVQILPFCPITTLKPKNRIFFSNFDLTNDLKSAQYTIIKDSNNNMGTFVLHPTKSKFTNNIKVTVNIENVKFENQCEFYRLCSPNWASIFEFNAARNGGVSYINIDCHYKPYQPYIHLNPDFKMLYGQDFNDARGLICSGDFSISSISDAFEQYALNNKNYQEMFNRQIENMDAEFDIAQKYTLAKSAAGFVGSGASAIGGAALGHPAAAAGGIIGMGTSALGGYLALNEQKDRYRESKDYTIDQHYFNLQNIKAKPDTLTKVSAYNNNNKIFPVLEKYSCTDEEKAIFLEKIKYEGMTINAIGKIIDYIGIEETFVKGRMIRLNDLDEDNHYAQEVIKEIALGLYFEKGE